MPAVPARSRSIQGRRFSLLALLTLTVSILLHLALLRSVAHWDAGSANVLLSSKPVVIQLLPPTATPEPPAPAAVPPRRKPAPSKPRPKPAPAPEAAAPAPAPAPAPVLETASQASVPEPAPTADTAADAADTADTADTANAASTPDQAADAPAAEQAPLAQTEGEAKTVTPTRAAPPPSALLNYTVLAKRNEGNVEGRGSIRFTRNQDSYSVDGEVTVLFMSLLSFQSSGQLDMQGLAPLLYTEKRFRKSATNTHFQRERQMVSFSASTLSYPRSGLEQDRASIVWQLAALGRGDAAQLLPGTELDIFVAGTRDGDTWHLQVTGEEQIQAAGQTLRALHVLRQPRPGSYDQRLDIWLAPGLQWYPVKLRFTEVNGDVLDLTLNDAQQTPVGN